MTPTDTAALVGALVLLAVVASLIAVACLTRRQARTDATYWWHQAQEARAASRMTAQERAELEAFRAQHEQEHRAWRDG